MVVVFTETTGIYTSALNDPFFFFFFYKEEHECQHTHSVCVCVFVYVRALAGHAERRGLRD